MSPKHDAPRASSSTIQHTAASAAAAASAPAPAPLARSTALRPPASAAAASTPSAQQVARAVSTPSTQSHAAHSNASGGGLGNARTAAAPLPHATAAAALQRSPSAPSAPAAHASAAPSSAAAHAVSPPPSSAPFLAHVDRMLSCALQVGNADVSAQGAADLLLHGYRDHVGAASTRGPGVNQLRRTASELREKAAGGIWPHRSRRLSVGEDRWQPAHRRLSLDRQPFLFPTTTALIAARAPSDAQAVRIE